MYFSSSFARALVLDAASRPQHAQTVLLQARDATASSGWQHLLHLSIPIVLYWLNHGVVPKS